MLTFRGLSLLHPPAMGPRCPSCQVNKESMGTQNVPLRVGTSWTVNQDTMHGGKREWGDLTSDQKLPFRSFLGGKGTVCGDIRKEELTLGTPFFKAETCSNLSNRFLFPQIPLGPVRLRGLSTEPYWNHRGPGAILEGNGSLKLMSMALGEMKVLLWRT